MIRPPPRSTPFPYPPLFRSDATIEPNRPEALVYEVDGDRLQLVAVEYIVPWTAWAPATPPQLFGRPFFRNTTLQDRKSTRLNSSHLVISYAVFCLKKKNHT